MMKKKSCKNLSKHKNENAKGHPKLEENNVCVNEEELIFEKQDEKLETIFEFEELLEVFSEYPEKFNQLVPQATISIQFDEPPQDSLPIGDATVTQDEESNNILKLDGDGDYLQIANEPSTNLLTALTISTWVKPEYSQGSSEFTIISKENSFILSVNNRIKPEKIVKFGVFDGIKWTEIESVTPVENGTYIAATFDRESISIYVDGKLEGTREVDGLPSIAINGKLTTKTVESISSDSDIIIGAYVSTTREFPKIRNQFSGLIDNVLLFDTLLNQTQIDNLASTFNFT